MELALGSTSRNRPANEEWTSGRSGFACGTKLRSALRRDDQREPNREVLARLDGEFGCGGSSRAEAVGRCTLALWDCALSLPAAESPPTRKVHSVVSSRPSRSEPGAFRLCGAWRGVTGLVHNLLANSQRPQATSGANSSMPTDSPRNSGARNPQ
jgi:hypothetical protein